MLVVVVVLLWLFLTLPHGQNKGSRPGKLASFFRQLRISKAGVVEVRPNSATAKINQELLRFSKNGSQ